MQDSLEPRPLAPGLWRLGGHHICLYLLRGRERSALFEVGIGANTQLVLAQLDALGVDAQEVAWLILSHAHSDHATGQVGLLQALPKADLLLSGASAAYLAKPSTLPHFAQEEHFTSPEVARREALPGPINPSLAGPLLPPAQRRRLVEDGFSLDLGGLTLVLCDAAGHVPGGFWGWVPELGAVLASDSAGFGHPQGPGFLLYFVSYPQYLATLEAIAALDPKVLGLGHQLSLQGRQVGPYLAAARGLMEREHQLIVEGFKAGRSRQDLAAGIFHRHYHGELTVYSPSSIQECCLLLVRRSLEAAQITP